MTPIDTTLQTHLRAATLANWLSHTEPHSRTMTFECSHFLGDERASVTVRLVINPLRPNAFRIEFPGGRRERYLASKHSLREYFEAITLEALKTFPAFAEPVT